MIWINRDLDIRIQLEKYNLIYPIPKRNGVWGLPNSGELDSNGEEECVNKYLNYLVRKDIIRILK